MQPVQLCHPCRALEPTVRPRPGNHGSNPHKEPLSPHFHPQRSLSSPSSSPLSCHTQSTDPRNGQSSSLVDQRQWPWTQSYRALEDPLAINHPLHHQLKSHLPLTPSSYSWSGGMDDRRVVQWQASLAGHPRWEQIYRAKRKQIAHQRDALKYPWQRMNGLRRRCSCLTALDCPVPRSRRNKIIVRTHLNRQSISLTFKPPSKEEVTNFVLLPTNSSTFETTSKWALFESTLYTPKSSLLAAGCNSHSSKLPVAVPKSTYEGMG